MMFRRFTDPEITTLLLLLTHSLVSATHKLLFDCTFKDGDWCAFNTIFNTTSWSVVNGELVLSTSTREAANSSKVFFTQNYYSSGEYCLKLEHQIADGARLVVVAEERHGNRTVVQWTSDGEATSNSRWIKFSQLLTVDRLEEFFLGFRGYEPENFVGSSIRLKRIHFYQGKCGATGVVEKCEFYGNLCQFTQQGDGSGMRWSATTGIGSRNSGPSDDHTANENAYYASTEGTGYNKGDKCSLTSPSYYVTSGLCVNLWYYMYGPAVGELNVYAANANGHTAKIWSREGEKKDKWLEATISYPVSEDTGQPHGYQVIIEAIQGETETGVTSGNIAIDDYRVEHCNIAPPAKTISCAFDYNLCLWAQVSSPTSSFYWTQKNNNPDDAESLLGTESCAFVRHDSSKARETEMVSKAVFESFCMTFYYKLVVDSQDSQLTIMVENEKYGGRTTVWRIGGKQSTEWQKARVAIALETNTQYAIRIKASFGAEIRKSVIAVDDILAFEFTDKCLTIPEEATPRKRQDSQEATTDIKWIIIGVILAIAVLLIVTALVLKRKKLSACCCKKKSTQQTTNADTQGERNTNVEETEYDSINISVTDKYEKVEVDQHGEYYTEPIEVRALPLLPLDKEHAYEYVPADGSSEYIDVIA